MMAALAVLAVGAQAAVAVSAKDVYGSVGVRPEAVLQGNLGSCYFHSVVAAIAATQPSALEHAIQFDDAGNIKVRFADGGNENVYLDDVQFARKSGYDRSDGLWVAILFRAFAQRTLRQALISAVKESEFSPLVKTTASGFLSSGDGFLLAYDRAIRAQVDQDGNVDRDKLEARLEREMAVFPVSIESRHAVVKMLDSKGFFDALIEKVKANGELFGAYRAVGQGGVPRQVLEAFTGAGESIGVDSTDMLPVLRRVGKLHQPLTASTGNESSPQVVSGWHATSGGNDWYVANHAYTVLDFNPALNVVTLRNPWGTHPEPGGKFTLSLDTFVSAYEDLSFSDALGGH